MTSQGPFQDLREASRRDLLLATRPALRGPGVGARTTGAASTTLAERMRELTAQPR